ncbi:site-2 protease family protein [Flavobacteriaceae bacterium 3-367]
MKGVLNLGRVADIKIQVHWTFALLLIWIVYSELKQGGSLQSSLFSTSLVLVLFLCVVLHELGHALTARKFNVRTREITLLPIGGVASMDKMPEKPAQELLVALAGPAVNVVIAIVLYFLIPVRGYLASEPMQILELLNTPSPQTFFFYLFIANVMLVVFNMVPAFPMDGGRVLRALLTLRMDRVRATDIAARIGQLLAVVFFVLGFLFNPFLILIALFIFIAAYGENKMVKQESLLEGHSVHQAMLTNITIIRPEQTVQEVVKIVLAGSERDFVVAETDSIHGVLYHKDIIKHAGNPELQIKDIMHTDFSTIDASEAVKEVFQLIAKERRSFFPVTQEQRLVGAIDMANLNEYILIRSNLMTE